MATYTGNIQTLQQMIAVTPFDIDPETDKEINLLLIQLKREVIEVLKQRAKDGRPMYATEEEVYFHMDRENCEFKKACQDNSPARRHIELWDYPRKGLAYFLLHKRNRDLRRYD